MAENLPKDSYYISLLSQYTPSHKSSRFPGLNRRITTYEYEKVVDTALNLGLNQGFIQQKSSAKEEYTPPFDLEGIWAGQIPFRPFPIFHTQRRRISKNRFSLISAFNEHCPLDCTSLFFFLTAIFLLNYAALCTYFLCAFYIKFFPLHGRFATWYLFHLSSRLCYHLALKPLVSTILSRHIMEEISYSFWLRLTWMSIFPTMALLLQIRCPMFLSVLYNSRNEIYVFGGPYLLYLDFWDSSYSEVSLLKTFSVFSCLFSCFVVLIITDSILFVNTFLKNFL